MTWNTLPGFVDGNTPTATDVNKFLTNLAHLHVPVVSSYRETNDASNLTTTSTTWADVGASWSKTVTTEGGYILALFVARIANLQIDLALDGTRLGTSGVSGRGSMQATTYAGALTQLCFPHLFVVAAGSHTIKVQWRVPASGTGTLYTQTQPTFFVVKMRGG